MEGRGQMDWGGDFLRPHLLGLHNQTLPARSEPPGVLPNTQVGSFPSPFLLKYKKCKGEIHDWCPGSH